MNTEETPKKKSNNDKDKLNLKLLGVPKHISHVKSGNTLCVQDNVLIFQNGSTSLEIRVLPTYESKHISWVDGLIRDIAWCSDLGVFVLLTQNALFTIDPRSMAAPATTTINTDLQLKAKLYDKIKPYNLNSTFWRCTCIGRTLYICYSGFGTIIDQYQLGSFSCKFVHRWTPPETCAHYEGIWCIRSHPNTNQIGMTIMDARTNGWRLEIRSRENLSLLSQIKLPVAHGDCELSPLENREWLVINACGVRFIQIVDFEIKVAVEYERELKNAVLLGNDYFAIRTKTTIEVHSIKKQD